MPWVVWITGLPGSGKSTIAEALKKRIPDVKILNMDELRKVVTPEPTYSDNERECVYRSIVYTAKILYELGHNVIIDATGNRKEWRDLARRIIPKFSEIYLRCPTEICIKREEGRIETHGAPKDIYKKGGRGWPVPGMNVAYEESEKPELIIHTDRESPEEAVERIIRMLSGKR